MTRPTIVEARPTIVEEGQFRVAIGSDTAHASFQPRSVVQGQLTVQGRGALEPRRAFVEYHRAVDGAPERALIGGVLEPSGSGTFRVVVATSGDAAAAGSATYPAVLGKAMFPGLPAEFGAAVKDALLRETGVVGTLVVDRAACDLAGSSEGAFGTAAALLALVLGCQTLEQASTAVRERLRDMVGWSLLQQLEPAPGGSRA